MVILEIYATDQTENADRTTPQGYVYPQIERDTAQSSSNTRDSNKRRRSLFQGSDDSQDNVTADRHGAKPGLTSAAQDPRDFLHNIVPLSTGSASMQNHGAGGATLRGPQVVHSHPEWSISPAFISASETQILSYKRRKPSQISDDEDDHEDNRQYDDAELYVDGQVLRA
jgi:hypothetical protein